VDQTRRHTAEKIEDEISNVAEPVFDVISEDIEEPHVSKDVKKSSVKKHGAKKREILLEPCKVSGELWIGISEGDHSVEIEDLFQMGTLKELPYKDKDIEADDNEIDSRKIL